MNLYYIFLYFLFLIYTGFSRELSFPAVVKARYKTIASQVPEIQEFPSRVKEYTLYYDRIYGGVRIEYKNENGVDIILIRNYHENYEARIERIDGLDLCEYSYLGSPMPRPNFSSSIRPYKDHFDNGVKYRTYTFQEQRQFMDIYVNDSINFPVRLDEFYINEKNNPEPLFSTVYESFEFDHIDPSVFDVLSLKNSGKCTRNSKGWPYQYLFGPFVKGYNPYFEDDDFALSAVAKSRMAYEKKANDRYHMAIDLIETPTNFVAICDVPGIPKDRIKIQVKENTIFIEGKRKRKVITSDDSYIICERINGPFKRMINVPSNCDVNKMVAKLEDGLLVLTMPKVVSEENATVIPIQYVVCFIQQNIITQLLFICILDNLHANFVVITYIFTQKVHIYIVSTYKSILPR